MTKAHEEQSSQQRRYQHTWQKLDDWESVDLTLLDALGAQPEAREHNDLLHGAICVTNRMNERSSTSSGSDRSAFLTYLTESAFSKSTRNLGVCSGATTALMVNTEVYKGCVSL
jgi:hypothetical protein